MFDVIIVGGGVHGVLSALYLHSENDLLRIAIFEKAKQLLPSYSEIEYFPFKDQMLTKADLERLVQKKGIQVYKSSAITGISSEQHPGTYDIKTRRAAYQAAKVIVSSGKDSRIFSILEEMEVNIEETLAASFPLETNDPRVEGLRVTDIPVLLSWVEMGLPKKKIRIQLASDIPETKSIKKAVGEIRIQARKLSGPVIRDVTRFISDEHSPLPNLIKISINWAPEYEFQGMARYLKEVAQLEFHKTISRTSLFALPRKLWTNLAHAAGIDRETQWSALKPEQFMDLAEQLTDTQIITKPSLSKVSLIAYKGGVASNMIDNSGECRKYPGLFFSGTILNDQVTHIKGENKSVAEGIQELAKKVVG